jgi:subtilase family serine protease
LEPGLKVKVSALVRAYSEVGNEIAGAYFFVGDQRTDIANEGTKATNGNAKLAYGTFTTIAVVDETGVLRFGVETASATFNFFGLKNVSAEIVPPSPDVTIASFTAPTTVALSDEVQSFDVTMTITNQGDADAKNVVVNLYEGFTVVATYPSSSEATTGAPAEGLSLAVGESMDITITYDKELTPGTSLSLSARVDCDDEYADYTDNNSTSSSRVKVVMDGSDMTITNVEAPKSLLITEGEQSVTGTIKVTVKNLGTQTAEGVSVVLNVNGEKYAVSDPITVEAGKEEVVEIEFSSSESGEYVLTAEVTSDADVDEENNLWADEIVIKVKNQGELTAGLDLSIENIDVPEMSDGAIRVNDEEGGYTVNVSVYNNGTEDAENVVVKLFINGEEFATNADVEGFETLNLASAEMVEIPFFVENPEFTDVEIYAEVIAEGDVDESNNVSETITAGVKYEGIDVALLDVFYPEAISMDSEEDAIVTVIVKNISEDSRATSDEQLKAENIVVHLYIDGVEVATSKAFSLYKGADAHAYLAIDRKYLTSEEVILTARVTADKDGNESNDWSEELPIQVSGVVTGIDSILARFGQNAQVYTLDGKKVDLSNGMLKKGLYIINGKKTAIK